MVNEISGLPSHDLVKSKVDGYIETANRWRSEFERLRALLLECPLEEEFKWGKPCYSFNGANVVILIGFKKCCALLFCKGALINDARGLLIKPGKHTQAARQMRFTDVQEIAAIQPVVSDYIHQAIEIERAGLQVQYIQASDLAFPKEFLDKMEESPVLRVAFEALTPGRRRAYHIYFSAPKRSETRKSRVEKCLPNILAGRGLNDR